MFYLDWGTSSEARDIPRLTYMYSSDSKAYVVLNNCLSVRFHLSSDLPASRSRRTPCSTRLSARVNLVMSGWAEITDRCYGLILWIGKHTGMKQSSWYFEMPFGRLSGYSHGRSLSSPQFARSAIRALDDVGLGATREVSNTEDHLPVGFSAVKKGTRLRWSLGNKREEILNKI